jgi:predicted transcriptional regulator
MKRGVFMDIDTSINYLPVYQALDSPVRLEMIDIISHEKVTATQLAKRMNISKAAISKNLHILENANIIKFQKGTDNRQNVPCVNIDKISINFPQQIFPDYYKKSYDIPIGNYFAIEDVAPSCGLATNTEVITPMDDMNVFFSTHRFQAHILWFTQGSIEYIIPNEIPENGKIELLEFDIEMASEFPMSNNSWHSKIGFWLNDKFIGSTELPGNYSDVQGRYTPDWWPKKFSQYGLLNHIRIGELDTSIDSVSISNVNINDLELDKTRRLTLKMAVLPMDNDTYGGLTLFGSDFGNHPQNIKATVFYSQNDHSLN